MPAELEGHACIASIRHGRPRPWTVRRGAERVINEPGGPIQSDDVELTRAAVQAGLGIARAASWLFEDELASGTVRQILIDYECVQAPISAVWSGDRVLPRRTAVFIDYLEAVCASEPTLRAR